MTKLQSLFYSLICNIVIVLVIDSISSVIGIDSSCLSLIMDLIPIILYVLSLGFCHNYLCVFMFFYLSLFGRYLPIMDRDWTEIASVIDRLGISFLSLYFLCWFSLLVLIFLGMVIPSRERSFLLSDSIRIKGQTFFQNHGIYT